MAAAKRAEKNVEILASLVDTLELCSSKVKEGSLGQVMEDLETSFSLQDFWQKLGMTFRAVSKEATKLAVMHSKPPLPTSQELQSMLTGFETAIIAMLTVFLSLPLSQGRTLHQRIQKAVSVIVEDTQLFIQALMKGGGQSNKATNQSTGALWEHCDAFNTFPLDNRHAVLEVFKSTSDLVKDALAEMEKAQADNGRQDANPLDNTTDSDANEQGWSCHDCRLVPPCIGLVKACRSCLKKVSGAVRTNGKVTSNVEIQELDSLEDVLQNVSPRVDEFVTILYAPMNHVNLQEKANDLAGILKELLEKSRSCHFTPDSDSTWLDFLSKAIDHNITKLSTEMAQTEANGDR